MRDYLQEPIIEELIEENLFHMLDEETDTEYVFRHSYMVFYFFFLERWIQWKVKTSLARS